MELDHSFVGKCQSYFSNREVLRVVFERFDRERGPFVIFSDDAAGSTGTYLDNLLRLRSLEKCLI